MSVKDYGIELTVGGKTVKTTSADMERASRVVKAGLIADKEGPHLADLEANNRRAVQVVDNKRSYDKECNAELAELEAQRREILAHLDNLRRPLPLFDGTERDCPACGDTFTESAWIKAGRCPGCKVKS